MQALSCQTRSAWQSWEKTLEVAHNFFPKVLLKNPQHFRICLSNTADLCSLSLLRADVAVPSLFFSTIFITFCPWSSMGIWSTWMPIALLHTGESSHFVPTQLLLIAVIFSPLSGPYSAADRNLFKQKPLWGSSKAIMGWVLFNTSTLMSMTEILPSP